MEEAAGKLKGAIVERGKGFFSWIHFGNRSLGCWLEGVEESCRAESRGKVSTSCEVNG